MNPKVFSHFFNPKSVAVVGASNNRKKIGAYIFSNAKDKLGKKAYPINLKSKRVQGSRAYARVSAIGKKVDLVIVIVPAIFVLEVVEDSAKAKVKNLLIISAGFKETGSAGAAREIALQKLIAQYKLNVIGPNCLGVLNAKNKLNLSFAKDIPESGDIGCISQSGAIIDALIDWSFKAKVGFSKVVSIGNMAGLDEIDVLQYLAKDKDTKIIVMYMETLSNGARFAEVLSEVSRKKPVIIMKPGDSLAAQKAIGSHTGSLAQNSVLAEALIRGSNGIFIDSIDELYNILLGFRAKKAKDNNLVVLTNAGGPGVISVDMLDKTAFRLYRLKPAEKAKFAFLPVASSTTNPIDILGDARSDRYRRALSALAKIKSVSSIFVLLTPQIMTDNLKIAKTIVSLSRKSKKSIFSCFLGAKQIRQAVSYFDLAKFANFATPHQGLLAMDKINQYHNFDYSKSPLKLTRKVNLVGQKKLLNYSLSRRVLQTLGIKAYRKTVVALPSQLRRLKLSSAKYVLKVDADIIHKKRVGALLLDVPAKAVKLHVKKLLTKFARRGVVTIEKQIDGQELIIGLKRDRKLGNFIMFGSGGSMVEKINDVNWAKAPLNRSQARNLVQNSAMYRLLRGNCNMSKLYDLVYRSSHLLDLYPEIKEVDFNPVICNRKSNNLVDVKLLV